MRLAPEDAEPQRAALRLARHRQQRRRSTRLTLAERPTCLATQGGRAAQPKAAPAAIPVMDDSNTRRNRTQVFGRARKSCPICQRGSGTPRDGGVDLDSRPLDFIGLSPKDAVHPDDRSKTVAGGAKHEERAVEEEIRVRRPDGQFRWWLFRSGPLQDKRERS